MSAAPSTLSWERWSSVHLDHNEPVRYVNSTDRGQDSDIPQFWKGQQLSWDPVDNCELPVTMSGNKLVVARESNQYWLYSIGGISIDSITYNLANCPIQVFKLCLDSDLMKWEEVHPVGTNIPVARYGHSCCYYNGKIYMYGGREKPRYSVFGAQGTVHCYNIITNEWEDVATLVEDNSHYPQPRYGHACTVNGNMMYIHGGHVLYAPTKWAFTSELFSFNMETGTWMLESPHYMKHPPPSQIEAVVGKPQNYLFLHRDFHVALYFNGKIILYGGRTPEYIIDSGPLCEFYEFNIASKQWKVIHGSGFKPGHRNHVMAERVGCYAILYGGEATHQWGSSFHNDTFIVDLRNYHCTKLSSIKSTIGGRCNVASCLFGSNIILYGGESIPMRSDDDVIGSTHKLVYHNDLYFLSLLPSLQSLCLDVIKSSEMDISLLPPKLKTKLC